MLEMLAYLDHIRTTWTDQDFYVSMVKFQPELWMKTKKQLVQLKSVLF